MKHTGNQSTNEAQYPALEALKGEADTLGIICLWQKIGFDVYEHQGSVEEACCADTREG